MPDPGQAERERCPTCGSADPEVCRCLSGKPHKHEADSCPDPFHTQPTGPESTKEHIERMRELTESVGERNARIHGSKTSGGALLEGRIDRPLRDQPASPPEESWEPDRALADLDTMALRERVRRVKLTQDQLIAAATATAYFADPEGSDEARLAAEVRDVFFAALADHREGEEDG